MRGTCTCSGGFISIQNKACHEFKLRTIRCMVIRCSREMSQVRSKNMAGYLLGFIFITNGLIF